MKQGEILDVVSEEDEIMRTATREEVVQDKLRHRAIIVFVFDDQGKLFLQKRSKDAYSHQGKYALSCAGKVKSGEAYEDAAERELKEELGITTPLIYITKTKHDDGQKFFAHVYAIQFQGDLTFEDGEVESGVFVSQGELAKYLDSDEVAPDDRTLITQFYEAAKERAME